MRNKKIKSRSERKEEAKGTGEKREGALLRVSLLKGRWWTRTTRNTEEIC